MDILRFITAGSVDDGKSTLIGRLLYDSKNILIDQLEQLEKQTRNKVNGEIDLVQKENRGSRSIWPIGIFLLPNVNLSLLMHQGMFSIRGI